MAARTALVVFLLFLSCSAEMDVIASANSNAVAIVAPASSRVSQISPNWGNSPIHLMASRLHNLLSQTNETVSQPSSEDETAQADLYLTSSVTSLVASILLVLVIAHGFKIPVLAAIPDMPADILGLISNILWVATFILVLAAKAVVPSLTQYGIFSDVFPNILLLGGSFMFLSQSLVDMWVHVPAKVTKRLHAIVPHGDDELPAMSPKSSEAPTLTFPQAYKEGKIGNKAGIILFFLGATCNLFLSIPSLPTSATSPDIAQIQYLILGADICFVIATIFLLNLNFGVVTFGKHNNVFTASALVGPILLTVGSVLLLVASV